MLSDCLGTGTGLVSIVLSLALKRIASLERKITATDLGKCSLASLACTSIMT